MTCLITGDMRDIADVWRFLIKIKVASSRNPRQSSCMYMVINK